LLKFLVLTAMLLAVTPASGDSVPEGKPAHPRLYFNAQDLVRLRKLRNERVHAQMWKNLAESADWCLTKTPRANWIAPVSPDPIYENLYDRFYGIMGDLAITEHLSFAYALSGKKEYGEAARQWVLASCRTWQHEADHAVDGGKAYAVTRLLKGVAVGYDMAYDRFSEAERKEVSETLVRIGRLYFKDYFQQPAYAGPGFHAHHATVEWSSFGIVALALLGDEPEAQAWLDATVKKFEEHLLPAGLAPDGAQIEGGSFWASTMHYRIFFMDALRHVTGRDLFQRFQPQMNADLALAEIAAEKFPGYVQNYHDVLLQPYYAQLDYVAPILLVLAREYRRPIFQYLAQWDHSLGQIQKTRAITPHGEQLLFELGGYAYLWYDSTVPAKPGGEKLSYRFPSVDEAYLRTSWKPDDLLVGVSKGQLVIHAGGQPVLFEPGIQDESPADLHVQSLEDNGAVALIRSGDGASNRLQIELNRPEHRIRISRRGANDWVWSCQGNPVRHANELRWGKRASVRVIEGELGTFDPTGYAPVFATGFNKLKLNDPAPMKFPRVIAHPSVSGDIVLEVKLLSPK
jgi:hypothetical protein